MQKNGISRKKTRVYKDEKGETTGIAMGWTESELRQLDDAMKKGTAESDAMIAAGLDPSNYNDFKKWEEMKKAKKDPTVISKGHPRYDEITEKLGITAKPGYPITESGKADLKVVKTKKKDRPNIRLMKNYDKELTDVELAQEGYNVQEITIIKRARDVMKKKIKILMTHWLGFEVKWLMKPE